MVVHFVKAFTFNAFRDSTEVPGIGTAGSCRAARCALVADLVAGCENEGIEQNMQNGARINQPTLQGQQGQQGLRLEVLETSSP